MDVAGLHVLFSTPSSSNLAIQWGKQTLVFTAEGNTTTLAFSSPNSNGYWGPVLDNVSVAAVPEPAGAALAGCAVTGLLIALARIRRYRHNLGSGPAITPKS